MASPDAVFSRISKSSSKLKASRAKWVPDHQAPNCMICKQQFNIRHRKHHCRNCGNVVCSDCSEKKLTLKGSDHPQRVCKSCHSKLTDALMEDVINRGMQIQEETEAVDTRLTDRRLPPWTYALRPFSHNGKLVGIGRLYVKVLSAECLPMPHGTTGGIESYCVLSLSDDKKTTKVVPKSTIPTWNEEVLLSVSNGNDVLKLQVYSQDRNFGDALLAQLHIPLATLSHQRRLTSWYPFPVDEKAAKLNETKGEDHKEGKSRIRLELQYTFSKVGEFFSLFSLDPDHETKNDKEFSIDLVYTSGQKIQSIVSPIWEGLMACVHLLQPPSSQPPATSGKKDRRLIYPIAALLFLAFACFPWSFAILFQLFLVRYVLWQYLLKKGWNRDLAGDASDASFDDDESERLVEDFHPFVLNVMSVAGIMDQSTKAQNMVVSLSRNLAGYKAWLQWRDHRTTARVIVVLMIALLYSCLICPAHVFIATVFWILTTQTAAVQAFRWIMAGFRRYGKQIKQRRFGWFNGLESAVDKSAS